MVTTVGAGGPKNRGSLPNNDKRLIFESVRPALGTTQPPVQWTPGKLTSVVKRPGREDM